MFFRTACIIFTLCISGCKKQEDTQAKFIAFAQTYKNNIKGLLINKVHKSEWKIRYGFADNNGCGGESDMLTAAITEALQAWLQALQYRGNIVKNFSYELAKTIEAGLLKKWGKIERSFYDDIFYSNPPRDKHALAVIFHCKEGGAFARAWANPIELHIYQEEKSYLKSAILHEIGHAFGLGDTYVDNSGGVERYNTNDGGASETVGTQPLSVMNLSYLMAYDPNTLELTIGADDHAGINWLYDFHYGKYINRDSCPQDYVYEPNTKGCTPSYPLIFAVKQARVEAVEKLLQEDSDIDLNQQDSLGNTALHYAANLAGLHGRELYDFLLKHGTKDIIKNKNNATAREILAGEHNKFVATMFAAVRKQGATQQKKIATAAQEKIMLRLVEEFVADNSNDVNMQDMVGNTLLHYAAIYDNIDLLAILRDRNDLDVNAQARVNAETALHKAARYGHKKFAMWMIMYYYDKIDTNIKDVWGKTALDRALHEGQQAHGEDKAQLADDFRGIAEMIHEIDLMHANKKQQSL